VLLVLVLLVAVAACSDDGGSSSTTSSSSDTSSGGSSTSTTADPALVPLLLTPADLTGTFSPAAGVDNTITTFCAGQDAAARLHASARALVGYTRDPAGASVIQLVFRFRSGDAETFVEQARTALDQCSNVPDIQGLAFAYEATTPSVDALFDGTDGHVTRYGTSAGSEALHVETAVFRHGDTAELVAVLVVNGTRDEIDALATSTFTAAVRRAG
jgi:hypothetical protein